MSDLRTMVDRQYEGINRHDLEMAVAGLADDVESILPGGPPMKGVEPFKQYVNVFQTAAPDAHIEGHRYLESGDTIVVEGAYSGTHTGPLMTPMGEIPPTGRHFEFTFCDILQARDGKAFSHRVYFDQADFMTQLGLMPAPAGA
jgi:ketosteroid isomerase-like protein